MSSFSSVSAKAILALVTFFAAPTLFAADRIYINDTGEEMMVSIKSKSGKIVQSGWLADQATYKISLTHNAQYYFKVRYKDGATAELGWKQVVDPDLQKVAFVKKTRVIRKEYVRPDGTRVVAAPMEVYTDLEMRRKRGN